jgi:hypothetical protein
VKGSDDDDGMVVVETSQAVGVVVVDSSCFDVFVSEISARKLSTIVNN